MLEIPLVHVWSIPLTAGGAMMAFAIPFVPASTRPVQAPEGHQFCRFCSAFAPLQAERCPQCKGLQLKEAS